MDNAGQDISADNSVAIGRLLHAASKGDRQAQLTLDLLRPDLNKRREDRADAQPLTEVIRPRVAGGRELYRRERQAPQ